MLDEPIDPELEARLVQNPYDWKSWKAYADWLIERGEPRGQVMRGGSLSPSPEAQAIISANWSRWFGTLPMGAVECDWRDGFVRDLRLKSSVPPDLTGPVLFLRRSLKFLQTLKFEPG